MEKKWSIMIIPNTSEQGYNISVTSTALKLSVIAIFLFVIAGFASCVASIHSWKKSNIRHAENLRAELEVRSTELGSLKKEFAGLIVLEEKLRAIAGLKPRQTKAGEAGTGGQGGPEFGETVFYETDEHPELQLLTGVEGMNADALARAIAAARDSFSEILEAFEKEQQRLSSIPSINPVYSPDAWISSGYGNREDPFNGKRKFHDGTDIVAPRRTPIIAPADGLVTFSGWREGLGRAVEIRHGYGYRTTYGHNEKLMVKKGATVKRGDVIAYLGSSGHSTGPHLHYEIRLNGKLVNPYQYVIE
jgi:murein DD-endopeptidase MepM/ murein hydrolase activator NlpD